MRESSIKPTTLLTAMPHILLIDDDIELCEMLSEYIQTEGFSVDTVHDGLDGIQQALGQGAHAKHCYDAIILDVMLPSADGFTVLRKIREQSQIPILMLTAKGDDIDRIVGLEMGADDYLPKPCNPRELVARLGAILRRTQTIRTPKSPYLSDDLSVNPASRQVILAGNTLSLTSAEYNLLEVLIRDKGGVVTKETLSEQAMGRKLTRYDRSIDMHLSKLRQKLGDTDQQRIQTVRGVGYQLCDVS
jgi:two-component system response regulator CpxR